MSAAASTLFELTAGDLQTLLTTGAITTADVVESCLQRIDDRGKYKPPHSQAPPLTRWSRSSCSQEFERSCPFPALLSVHTLPP